MTSYAYACKMEEEIDPYERQLLDVFSSCDGNGNGILDKNGFSKLCEALQLEDTHRSQLTSRLGLVNGKCDINFDEFRDALLVVLASCKSSNEVEDAYSYGVSEHETTPKFTFGGKKYGRHSRPSSTEDTTTETSDECVTGIGNGNLFLPQPQNGHTKKLFMETEYETTTEASDTCDARKTDDDNDVEIEAVCKHLGVPEHKHITNEELVSVCDSLGIPSSVYDIIRENIVKVQAIEVGKHEITYKDLFQLIKHLGCLVNSTTTVATTNIGVASNIPFNEDGISSVDISISGCISYDTLVYLFENAGISDAAIFLNDLGISPQFDVNLSELATQLQEELLNVQRCMDDTSNMYTLLNPHLLLLQASVVVSQAQIKWYKSCMEQVQCERDKLRNDLSIANERASLLAQEVDDNHARMENSLQKKLKLLEQKHSEQIKKLTFQWSTEREQLSNQNLKMEKQLEQLLHDETKLRSEVVSLKQDYENLEKENRNLLDQLVNAENTNNELEKEIQRLSSLKKKVLELESSNEQAISFLEKMNQLQAENILLRDKNDELVVELENVTLRQMQTRNGGSKRRGNSPLGGDENSDTDNSINRMFAKVRKYNTEKDLSIHSETLSCSQAVQCESGVEADISTSNSSLERLDETMCDSNHKVITELRTRVIFLENFFKKYQIKIPNVTDEIDVTDKSLPESSKTFEFQDKNLEKQCETLQLRLDQVQKEILKILSQKRACTEENCTLKTKISELMKHLPDTETTALSVFSSMETIKAEALSPLSISVDETKSAEFNNLSEFAFKVDAGLEKTLRSGKKDNDQGQDTVSTKQVTTPSVDTSHSGVFASISEEENEMEWKTIGDHPDKLEDVDNCAKIQNYNKLVQDYNNLRKENKTLSNKVEELQSCLDLMRSEYDQCEDYWCSKLDDERKLSEEEQRISDEKFAELQAKIEEYSELFACDNLSSQMMSKLPPIAENDKLEKEVTDLQEEFKTYKEKMEHENREKQTEIERLMQIISIYESASTLKNTDPVIEQSLESLKSDKTYILDKPSEYQNIPKILDYSDAKITELKQKKKMLKKECGLLQQEKESLMEQLLKMKTESRASSNYLSYNRVTQQQNAAENTKSGILLRLKQQEMKNRHLRRVLLQHQKKLNKTMKEMLEQHEKDLVKYRSALSSSQEMWQSLQETTKKQAEQITMSDVLVKELYCENSQLMATIHQLEQQQLDCPSSVLL